jgi:hypothetical protein
MRAALGRPLGLLLLGSAFGMTLGMIASKLLAQIVFNTAECNSVRGPDSLRTPTGKKIFPQENFP